jgi:hypothetical protein
MSNTNLTAALTKFANQDLNLARKNRIVAITGTKVGNVEVSYRDREYTVRSMTDGLVLVFGSAAYVREYLVSIYEVVTA